MKRDEIFFRLVNLHTLNSEKIISNKFRNVTKLSTLPSVLSLHSTSDIKFLNLWFLSQHINHRARNKSINASTRPNFYFFFCLNPRRTQKNKKIFMQIE